MRAGRNAANRMSATIAGVFLALSRLPEPAARPLVFLNVIIRSAPENYFYQFVSVFVPVFWQHVRAIECSCDV
jgi:hypothetical protein